ncbi:hypothetical protein EWM64_g9684 [Hericium alpestre]|uniref:Uncharacterized protein n=1 Tax=Hericium alpestre TaxID=135208 RepID=A0A4Y9ZLM6_9AGAM|nr:hypothetical protein EWM64_g9684 [Hericium alpestre]
MMLYDAALAAGLQRDMLRVCTSSGDEQAQCVVRQQLAQLIAQGEQDARSRMPCVHVLVP